MEIEQKNGRIEKLLLRARALDRQPRPDLCAKLEEESYAETARLSQVIRRAKALEKILMGMDIVINDSEMIVGEQTSVGSSAHTEAHSQRGIPKTGYLIPDFAKVLKGGFEGIKSSVEARLFSLDEANPSDMPKSQFLQAVLITCDAIIGYARRYSVLAKEMAEIETSESHKQELLEISRICAKVPAQSADTFHEALQSAWFVHLGIHMEGRGPGFSLGRFDQYMYPFYLSDIASGISKDEIAELVKCFWIKIYENDYLGNTGVQNLTLAGLTPQGTDGTNELSYLCLDVVKELKLIYPSVSARFHKDTPQSFLDKCLEVLKTGMNMPQFWKDEVMIDAMVHAGYALQDASDYALIGCHEPTVPGRTLGKPAANPGYFSFALMTQNAISKIEDFQSFDELFADFSEQMAQNIRNVVITQNHQDNLRWQLFPQPLLSSLMSDCIAKGMGLSEGGCRYNFSGFQGIGLATAADSLAAVKKLVFEKKSIEKRELLSALENNFEGYEVLRQRLLNDAPKWGNDDDYVDEIAIAIVEAYRKEVDKYTNFRGGKFIPALWSFYVNIDFGRRLGTSADGRKAGEPVSHSIGPSTGAASNGPTAILKSCAKLPHRRLANGTSLLWDFQPFLLRKEETLEKFKSLVKSAMSLGLMQLHCNIINTDKLEEAKLHPELYRDLIVRVAGYRDYFVHLSEPLQNFVIERTKHEI